MLLQAREFLDLSKTSPILDVRSPSEFAIAHLPGATSFPLFDDNERALVGTVYKNKGQDVALKLGLDIVGPKMSGFISQAQMLAPNKKVRVHCWRGGMRSQSVAWLLSTAGFEVEVLEGGYKAFRQELRRAIAEDFEFRILGGYTGSAKTQILLEMKALGAQVIDLEAIAKHKGSAFGNLHEEEQPETDQFIIDVWNELRRFDPQQVVWIEDESRTIGHVYVSDELHAQIKNSRLIFLERTLDDRAQFLARDYGNIPDHLLKDGFRKITKRLGGQKVNEAIEFIENGQLAEAAKIGLNYYDKAYQHGLDKRNQELVQTFDARGKSVKDTAKALMESTIWK